MFEGEFYIHQESGLIHSTTYALAKENVQYTKTFNLLGTKVKTVGFEVYIQYGMLDEKCHPKYSKVRASIHVFDKKGTDITHAFTTEMIVNSIQYENIKPFNSTEIWHKNSIYKRGNNYKSNFWEGRRGLLATEEEQKIIESLTNGHL